MWELDYTENWALKNWCFWTVVLEKTLESPLDWDQTSQSSRESILNIHWKDWCWSLNSNTLATWWEELTLGKDSDAGKDWRQEVKRMTEDEMVGRHHRLNGHEFEEAPGDGEGQESLACCSPWGHKESDRTKWLNNNNLSVHCSTVHKSQDIEATCMSNDRWMNEDVVVHIFNGILLSHKRTKSESVELRWMHWEPVTQNEVRKKNKRHINTHGRNLQK